MSTTETSTPALPHHAGDGDEIVTNELLYEVSGELVGSVLVVEGLPLADVIEYDVLRIFGRMFKQNNERIGDGRH